MAKNNSNKPSDGRKYKMGLLITLVLLVGFGVAGLNGALGNLYGELITGCSLIYFTYCGGNIGNKWVGKKANLGKPTKDNIEDESK